MLINEKSGKLYLKTWAWAAKIDREGMLNGKKKPGN